MHCSRAMGWLMHLLDILDGLAGQYHQLLIDLEVDLTDHMAGLSF